jgi:hypothetical protein
VLQHPAIALERIGLHVRVVLHHEGHGHGHGQHGHQGRVGHQTERDLGAVLAPVAPGQGGAGDHGGHAAGLRLGFIGRPAGKRLGQELHQIGGHLLLDLGHREVERLDGSSQLAGLIGFVSDLQLIGDLVGLDGTGQTETHDER